MGRESVNEKETMLTIRCSQKLLKELNVTPGGGEPQDGYLGGGGSSDTASSSSDKAITAYSLDGVTGTINETAKTIAVSMPYGTNVTALVATFTTTGSSVKVGSTVQTSGTTANDFTSPVVYIVTAADSTTATYTVTVSVALYSAKAITAFSLDGVTGTINETAKTIAVSMPYGTNVTALIATFTTTGSSVKVGSTVQTSGTTANDFTSPVSYIVTAADNTTATYTVTVSVALSSAKAITAYSLDGVTGTINETAKTIAVSMSYGTNVTALVATFTTTGAGVKIGSTVQTSGTTANDFTSPVVYIVTAADSTTATYTVTVSVALNSAKAITAYSLAGVSGTINETAKTISVSMPYGTNVTALIATFTTTGSSVKVGSTVQTSGTTANDFTSPVVYTVTAADGTTATYTVTVTVAAASGAVSLPKTGQTTSYATGDDGDLEKGVAWPYPRFTVGTGAEADCMTDNLTGLMWVKSPDSTTRTWTNALTYADGLTLCGHTDWRLPNVNELESLINAEQSNTATWLNTEGFSNVQAGFYWSSTTYASNTAVAWLVIGYPAPYFKTVDVYVLPVRAGQATATTDLPQTGQTTSYATGDDGDLEKGVAWPDPRFTVDTGAEADCVTDNLTGLMWVKSPDSTTRAWADALTYADGLSLCGYTDWRLPNRKELRSLVNYGQSNSATWLNAQGFSNVQADYWSSTTNAYDTAGAWFVIMYDGSLSANGKSSSYYVWPVRSGQ